MSDIPQPWAAYTTSLGESWYWSTCTTSLEIPRLWTAYTTSLRYPKTVRFPAKFRDVITLFNFNCQLISTIDDYSNHYHHQPSLYWSSIITLTFINQQSPISIIIKITTQQNFQFQNSKLKLFLFLKIIQNTKFETQFSFKTLKLIKQKQKQK